MSDSQFPTTLNNTEKQIQKAKELTFQHLGVEVISAQLTKTQGCFSKTIGVTLEDGRNIIIQFRIEALELEPFSRARSLLGDMVPIIEAIVDPELVASGVWSFYMTRIPGKPLLEYEDIWDDEQRIKCLKSLGRIFAPCFVGGKSSDVVDSVVLPNLRKIRAVENVDLKTFYPFIDQLIKDAPALKQLPLFLGHFDLNEINALADEDAEITGLVDWELSPPPQPFGLACYCIQFIAGEIIDGVFRERPAYEAMDRGFWEELFSNTPKNIKDILIENLEAVQTSVLIGVLFRTIPIEGDKIFVSKRRLEALPKLMQYRIPAIRGPDKAYSHDK